MRYIIGIIVGILIILNWGSVKTMFDSKLAQQTPSEANAKVAAQPAPPPPSAPEDIVARGVSEAAADQAKQ
jgi:hypothetical protein